MAPDELELAVERHATSKLPDDDLLAIHHLRLPRRGPAVDRLGGAAAPDQPAERRRQRLDACWSKAAPRASRSRPPIPSARRVEVRDLFFATPARLKFLKSPRAETRPSRRMSSSVWPWPIPASAFTLADEQPLAALSCRPASGDDETARLERLSAMLGRDFAKASMPIDAEREGLPPDRPHRSADLQPGHLGAAISVRQWPAGARQAAQRRGARRLCRCAGP